MRNQGGGLQTAWRKCAERAFKHLPAGRCRHCVSLTQRSVSKCHGFDHTSATRSLTSAWIASGLPVIREEAVCRISVGRACFRCCRIPLRGGTSGRKSALLRFSWIVGDGLAIDRRVVCVGDAPAGVGLDEHQRQDIAALGVGLSVGGRRSTLDAAGDSKGDSQPSYSGLLLAASQTAEGSRSGKFVRLA